MIGKLYTKVGGGGGTPWQPAPLIIEVDATIADTTQIGEYIMRFNGGSYCEVKVIETGQTFDLNVSTSYQDLTIVFTNGSDVYTIEITPNYPSGIKWNPSFDKLKFKKVVQFGSNKWQWAETNKWFYGLINLKEILTIPDLSQTNTLGQAFQLDPANNVNPLPNAGDIGDLDTSTIKNFYRALWGINTDFVLSWNFENAETMEGLFGGANTPLGAFKNGGQTWQITLTKPCDFRTFLAKTQVPSMIVNGAGNIALFHDGNSFNASSWGSQTYMEWIELKGFNRSFRVDNYTLFTDGLRLYNLVNQLDHSATETVTLSATQKANLLTYLQTDVDPTYTQLSDWLIVINSNWTIA